MKEIYEAPEVDLISFKPTDSVTNADLEDMPVVGGSTDVW